MSFPLIFSDFALPQISYLLNKIGWGNYLKDVGYGLRWGWRSSDSASIPVDFQKVHRKCSKRSGPTKAVLISIPVRYKFQLLCIRELRALIN